MVLNPEPEPKESEGLILSEI